MEYGPVPFDRILIKEFDAAQSDGAGASGPLLNVFDVEKIITEFLLGDLVRGFLVMLSQ